MNPKTRLMLLVAIAMPAGGIVFAQDGQSDIQRRIAEARQKSIREMSERRQQQGAQAFAPREVNTALFLNCGNICKGSSEEAIRRRSDSANLLFQLADSPNR